MKKSRIVAFSGIMSALSIVMLFLGSTIWVLGYVMPIVCSLIMIIILDLTNKKTALMTYAITSLLSLIFLSDKECPLFYALFFGFYPIARDLFNKVKNKLIRYIPKLVAFNISMLAIQLICVYVFGIPFDDIFGKWEIILFAIALNLIFVVYDKLYDLLVILYNAKLKHRITKYFR